MFDWLRGLITHFWDIKGQEVYSCHFMLQVATAPGAAGVAPKRLADGWTPEVNFSLHWSVLGDGIGRIICLWL